MQDPTVNCLVDVHHMLLKQTNKIVNYDYCCVVQPYSTMFSHAHALQEMTVRVLLLCTAEPSYNYSTWWLRG